VSASWALILIVGLVALQRLGELLLAQRNTVRLLSEGAVESGARHYPLFVALHTGWLVAIVVFAPADPSIDFRFLAAFAILQAARIWVIASLGRFWTTRIISLPGAPLVRHGPYRFWRHPNYLIVIGEIAILPLAFGEAGVGVVFSILNLFLMRHRIRVEEAALGDRAVGRTS
jgi:methyltransferase